jgi:hypothetical protein
MRYALSADFEDEAEIEAFLSFVRYHSLRLKCPVKDVFLKLALEWKRQNEVVLQPKSETRGKAK